MKGISQLLICVVIMSPIAACATASGAPEADGSGPRTNTDREPGAVETTIWDGVYSVEQAQRGERAAWTNCYSCHSSSEWSSETFMGSPSTMRLGDLFNVIRQSMPYDSPGSLSEDTYSDIVAYILSLRGAPAGDQELSSRLEALDRILVTPPR